MKKIDLLVRILLHQGVSIQNAKLGCKRLYDFLDTKQIEKEHFSKITFELLRNLKVNPVRADNIVNLITAIENEKFESLSKDSQLELLSSVDGIGSWSIQAFEIYGLIKKNIIWGSTNFFFCNMP